MRQSTQGARYEVHEKKAKKRNKRKQKKKVCGVATKLGSHASLYRARAGAWACRWGHVREARVSVISTHEQGWVNSGVHQLT